MDNIKELQRLTYEAREKFWTAVGNVEPDVLAPLINPAFSGGPKWPSLRQAYKKIVTNDGILIIASDGLSDPFENTPDKKVNGFELEFYVETNQIPENVQTSWQFDLVYQMSQNAASSGQVRAMLDKYQYITTEMYDVRVPQEFLNQSGRVGVILGVPSKRVPEYIDLPLSKAKVVSIILLTTDELKYVVEKGAEGRKIMAERLMQAGGALNSLNRLSVNLS